MAKSKKNTEENQQPVPIGEPVNEVMESLPPAQEPDVFDQAIAARNGAETPSEKAEVGKVVRPNPHGFWRDNEAGVRVEEDWKNKLTTFLFRDTPPDKALEMLSQNGYVEDNGAYSKKIDKLREYEHRENAEQLALDVTNAVREKMGLPEKQSFYISRS